MYLRNEYGHQRDLIQLEFDCDGNILEDLPTNYTFPLPIISSMKLEHYSKFLENNIGFKFDYLTYECLRNEHCECEQQGKEKNCLVHRIGNMCFDSKQLQYK